MTDPTDRAHQQLAQALTRAESPVAREHIRAAMAELNRPERLVECPDCGRLGTEGRLICTACAE